MPGTVIALLVAEGDDVAIGQTVAIVEAMKMEHTLVASAAGVVATVHARQGQPVRLDEPVVTIAAVPNDAGRSTRIGTGPRATWRVGGGRTIMSGWELSDEHEMFRGVVREFAEAEIAPHAAQWDRRSSLSR